MSKPPERFADHLWTVFAYALPVLLAVALPLIYIIDRRFYLRYILKANHREYQFVELATMVLAFIGSVLILIGGLAAWRVGTADRAAGRVEPKPGAAGWLDGRGGAAVILLLAAGTFFFAGEEISWGQTYFGWESELRETNLHNTVPISFSGLGSLVIVGLLVVGPIAWRLRHRLPVPQDWAPAIAQGPVIAAVIVGFAIGQSKDIAQWVLHDGESNRIYIEYFEQLHEQKELFIALAMFMYGWYRIRGAACKNATGRSVRS